MEYSEDHIAIAAEYALGTLDADERAQVETMMTVDPEFTAMVQSWEFRLGVLNQMVGSVEPRPELWERVRAAVGHSSQQAPLVLPEAPPSPLAQAFEAPEFDPIDLSERTAPEVDTSNVIQLSAQARRWRRISSVMETGRISDGWSPPDFGLSWSDKEGFLDALNREVFSSRFRRLWLPEGPLSGWLFPTIIQWLTGRFLDLCATTIPRPISAHFSGAERASLR